MDYQILKSYIKSIFSELSINKQKVLECWKVTSSEDLEAFLINFLETKEENVKWIMKFMSIQIKFESILEEMEEMSQQDYATECESKCAEILQFIAKEQMGSSKLSLNVKKKSKDVEKPLPEPSIVKQQVKLEKNSIVKQVKMEKNSIVNQAQIRAPSVAKDIVTTDKLKVIVKYAENKVFQDYQHNKYALKKCLQKYILKHLSENQIQVQNPRKKVNILDEISYLKSSDAGNYKFDPFCGSIKIFITHVQDQLISDNIIFNKIDKIKISHEYSSGQEKQQVAQTLYGKDSIVKLVKFLCDKKQQSEANYDQVVKAFTLGHSVKVISDLFPWKKEDFSNLKLKVTWIYELLEIVQQIKDFGEESPEEKNKRISNKDKNNCIKVANSHKILRYLVYKAYGFEELRNLAKLNFQNMKRAIQIVKKQIINEQLLDDLEKYFFDFTDIPKKDEKTFSTSRGMILFGPPGTGKTELTESLPNLIGFHLIERGLSAADFMKTHVGQSSRMIRDLVNRAKLSPHLLCSIGIDEIDGLVPDRKDKDEKNKGEGISMLLSVIGGNKDVPNLVFMASTNYLKKIDEAIRRRLSGQFQVGRPNPQARQIMILNDLPFLSKRPEILQKLKIITANFTGAALKRLNALIHMKMKKKQMQKSSQIQLTVDQILQGATQIAKQFSITLGIYTFPEIYALRSGNKFLFTLNFLNRISNKFLLVKYKQKGEYKLYYSNKQTNPNNQQKRDKRSRQYFEMSESTIYLQKVGEEYHYDVFQAWVKMFFENVHICKKIEQIQKVFTDKKVPTLLIVQDLKEKYAGSILYEKDIFSTPKHNLYVLYYIGKLDPKEFITSLNWQINLQKPFSGKILVELNEQPRMAFQLNTADQDETKLYFKHFLKTEKTHSANDIIPELIQFFSERQVNYTLLIDYQLILQNDAFDEEKMFQVIEQKMSQAVNYSNVAVIINLDSLIVLNQSSSDSSMGRSKSYSIADHNMYRLLLHYMRELAIIDTKGKFKKEKWVAIIAKNVEIVKLIKADLKWPFSPEESQEYFKEQALEMDKRCVRCGLYYKERENMKERKCMQHPGPLIDLHFKKIEENMTITEARLEDRKYKERKKTDKDKNKEDLYSFACCMKGINQAGECAYHHLTKDQLNTDKDQLWLQRERRFEQWESICNKL